MNVYFYSTPECSSKEFQPKQKTDLRGRDTKGAVRGWITKCCLCFSDLVFVCLHACWPPLEEAPLKLVALSRDNALFRSCLALSQATRIRDRPPLHVHSDAPITGDMLTHSVSDHRGDWGGSWSNYRTQQSKTHVSCIEMWGWLASMKAHWTGAQPDSICWYASLWSRNDLIGKSDMLVIIYISRDISQTKGKDLCFPFCRKEN